MTPNIRWQLSHTNTITTGGGTSHHYNTISTGPQIIGSRDSRTTLIIARIIAMGKDSCQLRAFSSFVELQNRLSSRRKTSCLSFSRVCHGTGAPCEGHCVLWNGNKRLKPELCVTDYYHCSSVATNCTIITIAIGKSVQENDEYIAKCQLYN